MSEPSLSESDLAADIAGFRHDPYGFVMYAIKWNEGPLKGKTGPRKWQVRFLKKLGELLSKGEITVQEAIQMAIASGHGIGKSALVAWIILWALSTFEDTKGIITANTEAQLKGKTWAELAKWYPRIINRHWFVFTATAIYSAFPDHEKTWRMDMVNWNENNTEAFAGLHNEGKRILVIFDEASAIADKIWEVTEGVLTDADTEIIWLCFGNPTRNTGRFKDCFGKLKHRWYNEQIDSRDVEGTNKDQINKWVEDYGVDSDFVKVRVRGIFPSASLKQFISTDDVDKAFGKHLHEQAYSWAPKILTLDNSWEGDDEGVIGIRQGLAFRILLTYAKNDNDVEIANVLARFEDEEKADAVFIDAGYGTGVASVGKSLGRNWRLVWFGEKSSDPAYLNKRSEMYGLTKQWLKEGGAIPKDPVLYQDLIGPETVSRVDGKIQLEAKKDMKARGLPSPGRADALALSFAFPVHKNLRIGNATAGKALTEYDPHSRE